MIAEEIIRQAETLLAHGKMSQREVAKRTGLSRGIVSLIARERFSFSGMSSGVF